MIELNRIAIAKGLELPIICDLNVLAKLQNRFGTLEDFELKIVTRDEHGKKKEPDIMAVITGLDLMLQEGAQIDNEENGADHDLSMLKGIQYKVERDYRMIARDIHEEMRRCFKVKK